MVEFKKITPDNFKECINLELKEGQDRFVADNLYSLAQAYIWEKGLPFAIYEGNTMVGFIMFYYDEKEKAGDLWRFMIAAEHQGKGYGREAMGKMVGYFKGIDECRKIELSYVPGNAAAEKLYKDFGFIPTGEVLHGEIVMELKLK